MAVKYKFKLLEKEIKEINQILSNNGVTFSFEKIDEYVNALREISPLIHKSYARYLSFLQTKISKYEWENLIEYDVNTMSIISNGVGYPSKFVANCPIEEVITSLKSLIKLFDNNESVLDIKSNIGLMFAGNKREEYEGCYYWLNKDIFSYATTDLRKHFLNKLSITTNHSNFIELYDDSDVILHYVGYNKDNKLSKSAFLISTEDFCKKNPEKYYDNYHNISEVCDILRGDRMFDAISVQLTPNDENYLAFEISLKREELDNYFNLMIDSGLLDDNRYQKIINHNYNFCNDDVNYIIKYRWHRKVFQIKLYTEEMVVGNNPIVTMGA